MFWKKTEKRSLEYAESIVNTVREPLIVLDQDLRVVSASRSFYEVFKVKPEETVGQLIYAIITRRTTTCCRSLLSVLSEKSVVEN